MVGRPLTGRTQYLNCYDQTSDYQRLQAQKTQQIEKSDKEITAGIISRRNHHTAYEMFN